jgi:hypothetical protein
VVQLLVLPAIINTDSGCWHDQLHNHHTMAESASASSPDLELEGTLEFRDTLTSGDPGPGHVELLYADGAARSDGVD